MLEFKHSKLNVYLFILHWLNWKLWQNQLIGWLLVNQQRESERAEKNNKNFNSNRYIPSTDTDWDHSQSVFHCLEQTVGHQLPLLLVAKEIYKKQMKIDSNFIIQWVSCDFMH